MNEKILRKLLQRFPNARRASQGIIVPTDDGGQYHITNVHSQKTLDSVFADEHRFLAFCSQNEIIRMRNLKSPHDYLLRIRAEAIASCPRAVRVMVARKNRFSSVGRTWSLTEYYHSKDHFQKSYIQNLSKPDARILRKIPSGLALINQANAMCIRTFTGDIVVVYEALQNFFYFMTIGLFGNNYQIETADTVNALLIATRIMNGSESLDFDLDSRGELPPKIERKIQRHVLGQMQFAFGHEFAHYLKGHLATPEMLNFSAEYLDKPEVALPSRPEVFEHELEFEADFYSIKSVVSGSEKRKEISYGAFSVLIFMEFFHNLESMPGLKKFSASSSHPDPISRIWRLWNALDTEFRPSKDWIEGAISTTKSAQDLLKHHIDTQDRNDLLIFYGSIYLPTFKSKIRRDRIDF